MIFHACGGDGHIGKKQQSFLQKIANCNNIESISLRDSFGILRDIIITHRDIPVKETYDIAFAASKYFSRSDKIAAEFGIGVISREELFQNQLDIIRFCLEHCLDFKVFTNGSRMDEDMALRLLYASGINKTDIKRYKLERPLDAEALINSITSFSKIISIRMHSLIIANSYGIRNFGIIYDDKVREMYQKINAENRCDYPNEMLDYGTVFQQC